MRKVCIELNAIFGVIVTRNANMIRFIWVVMFSIYLFTYAGNCEDK